MVLQKTFSESRANLMLAAALLYLILGIVGSVSFS